MKKLTKKLQLNKETIARLNDDQQQSIYGGWRDTDIDGCVSREVGCPGQPKPVNTQNFTCTSMYLTCMTYSFMC